MRRHTFPDSAFADAMLPEEPVKVLQPLSTFVSTPGPPRLQPPLLLLYQNPVQPSPRASQKSWQSLCDGTFDLKRRFNRKPLASVHAPVPKSSYVGLAVGLAVGLGVKIAIGLGVRLRVGTTVQRPHVAGQIACTVLPYAASSHKCPTSTHPLIVFPTPLVTAIIWASSSAHVACSVSIVGAVELNLRALALPRRLRLLSAAAVDAESRAWSAHRAAETMTGGILEAVSRPERLCAQVTSQLEKDLHN